MNTGWPKTSASACAAFAFGLFCDCVLAALICGNLQTIIVIHSLGAWIESGFARYASAYESVSARLSTHEITTVPELFSVFALGAILVIIGVLSACRAHLLRGERRSSPVTVLLLLAYLVFGIRNVAIAPTVFSVAIAIILSIGTTMTLRRYKLQIGEAQS